MDAYGIALKALHPQPVPGHHHLDQVAHSYAPLADYGCISIKGVSCAESALMLARAQVWLDNTRDIHKNKPAFDGLQHGASAGLTVGQMVRRLQRARCNRFPLYMFQNGEFVLQHGFPREDHWAVVFIPADVNAGFPVAHWTYATVLPTEEPEVVPIVGAVVIYTSFPLDDARLHIYWRARVMPENRAEYEAFQTRGRACDCDWHIACQHENAFLAQANYPGATHRLTLEEEVVVEGTKRAQVAASVQGSSIVVRMGAEGRIETVTSSGHSYKQLRCHHSESLAIHGAWQRFKRTFRNNKLADYRLLDRVDVSPFSLNVLEYADYNESISYAWYHKCAAVGTSIVAPVLGVVGRAQYVAQVTSVEGQRAWAADQDLTLTLPRRRELLLRLSLRTELTRDNVMDTVRRMAAEEGWIADVGRAEFQDWLNRVTEVGKATMIPSLPPDACWNCLKKRKTYRHVCAECRKNNRAIPREPVCCMDVLVVHVGVRPLWSKSFKPPTFLLKSDVSIYDRIAKRSLVKKGVGMAIDSLFSYFRKFYGERSQRGQLTGPMFLGLEPTCFPRGEGVAATAFAIRLGSARAHIAVRWFYDLAYDYVEGRLDVIEPETWKEFISHFTGDKRDKMEEARRDELDGWSERPRSVPGGFELPVRMTGFAKAEKSSSYNFVPDGALDPKPTEKPRFICSPNPIVLARLGRYTHAQTKWLSKKFDKRSHLFYAGCAQPEDLHDWLNWTLSEIPEPYSLVDDISAMDSNHSSESFRYHRKIRAKQFPHIEQWISLAFDGEERFSVRVGRFTMSVNYVNASGVSDTSYKNSMICLIVRLLAVAHGFRDLRSIPPSDVMAYVRRVELSIYLSASGDDGLTRLPDKVDGIPIADFSMTRYREAWSWAGFGIKANIVPPNRWRMATYLAMRPVWVGSRYEWAPEPARRLKHMFWQFDNGMHPVAWARGVASQVLEQGRAVPVLSHVMRWFLRTTRGPVAKVDVIHRYSAFYGSRLSGDYNERAEAEFCLDYRVTKMDLGILERALASTSDHLVNFDTHALRRVFAEES